MNVKLKVKLITLIENLQIFYCDYAVYEQHREERMKTE